MCKGYYGYYMYIYVETVQVCGVRALSEHVLCFRWRLGGMKCWGRGALNGFEWFVSHSIIPRLYMYVYTIDKSPLN